MFDNDFGKFELIFQILSFISISTQVIRTIHNIY